MKSRTLILFVGLSCAYAFFTSCKKNDSPVDPVPPDEGGYEAQLRLKSIGWTSQGSPYKYTLAYNADGTISHVRYQSKNQSPVPLFDINYSGNEITITRPVYASSSVEIYDTIHLTMDVDSNVISRIQSRYVRTKAPENLPGKTYLFDTTSYEYNDVGLLIRAVHTSQDSAWSLHASGDDVTIVTRTMETMDYTIEENKLVSMMGRTDVAEIVHTPSGTTEDSRSEEHSLDFDYSKSSPNKIDYSNAGVLSELHLFTDLPLKKNYSFLPDKVHHIRIKKNRVGVVYATSDTWTHSDFTFNSYGCLTSKCDPAIPDMKISYWYNK